MPGRQQRRGKRQRHASSPGQTQTPSTKKHKIRFPPVSGDSVDSDTDYFDAIDSDGEIDTSVISGTPPVTPPLVSDTETETMSVNSLTEKDLEDLCSRLAPILVKQLSSELKKALKSEIMDEVKKEVKVVIDEATKNLKQNVSVLESENKNLRDQLKEQKIEMDEQCQYGRRMCLDIAGIPGDRGSESENVEQKILQLATTANIELTSADIDKCHRKGKWNDAFMYNRKTIVKFTNSKARDRVYRARKAMPDGIFVSENLTPYREYLGYEARKLKREKHIDKTFVAGSKIKVELKNGRGTVVIRHIDDITQIRDNTPAPGSEEESMA